MDKRSLSERDICTKFITPALRRAGWDEMLQIREEVSFTKGRIIVRGKLVTRGQAQRADYILYYKPNIPVAVIEAKDNSHSVGDGMQQALDYAETLNVPFVVLFQRRRLRVPRPHRREHAARDGPRSGRFSAARGTVGALLRLEGPDPGIREDRPSGLSRRWQRQGPALLPGQRRQRRDRGHRHGPGPHPARHGHRHGQDLHRLPDHLAAVEGRTPEAHPVPRRPQRTGRPDDGERFPDPSAEPWPSCPRRPRPYNATPTAFSASIRPTKSISAFIRRSPARRKIRKFTASSLPDSST